MILTTPASFQLRETARRYAGRKAARQRNLKLIQEKRYLEVDAPERVARFLKRHGFSRHDAESIMRQKGPLRSAPLPTEAVGGAAEPFALERVLGTNDLMGVSFLERGLQAARTVGRIWIGVRGGRPGGYGTGFLVSPRLLMTNHHVLGDPAVAGQSLLELNYQMGLSGEMLVSTRFALDPGIFFKADEGLDYALVAVRTDSSTSGPKLSEFGWNPLIEEEGKAILPQYVNIIQHPNAEPKQLCLRENQMIDLLEEFVHYTTDTAPGSSGSPVFNDRWEVIALHHSGVPKKNKAGQIVALDGRVWRREMGEHRICWEANEGARVSRIIRHVREKQSLDAKERRLVEEMLDKSLAPETGSFQTIGRNRFANGDTDLAAGPMVSDDGVATWNIPLSVSVRVGNGNGSGPKRNGSPHADDATITTVGSNGSAPTPHDGEDEIVAAARRELQNRSGVLKVRRGYVFKNGWITDEAAIVVTVDRRSGESRETEAAPLPTEFRGLPVEVTQPSLADLVATTPGASVVEALGNSDLLTQEITYKAPPGVSLDAVKRKMQVNAHLGPDAGWPELEAFLAATKKRLVIGVYDFGAKHIVDAIIKACKKPGFQKLTLVMQAGESVGGDGTKKNDLKDQEVVDRFSKALGKKFEYAWVKIGSVNGWVSSSYHIKVIVRDSSAFWLSSGNLQSSNQPKASPLTQKPQNLKWLSDYNREWHAILHDTALAKAYEAHLLNDFKNNRKVGHEASLESLGVLSLPELFVPAEGLRVAAKAKRRYFKPFETDRVVAVQPLLTPDNYHKAVVKLIAGAKDELLIQNQTFNAPKAAHAKLKEVMDAVLEQQQSGVKVRIIFRHLFAGQTREKLEQLKDFGFDMSQVRVQSNCHTKGIIADRRRVLLGSQNLSNDGVSVNRDASLLFDDRDLANYFAECFEHDWENMASQNIGRESVGVELATDGGRAPRGMTRISWKEYVEML